MQSNLLIRLETELGIFYQLDYTSSKKTRFNIILGIHFDFTSGIPDDVIGK